jgi:hypothetical protein
LAWFAVVGLLAGALTYDVAFQALQALGLFSVAQSITLPVLWGLPYAALGVTFGVLLLLMLALADRLDPGKRLEEPVPAGESLAHRILRREWGWAPASVSTGALILLATYLGQYLGVVSGFAALLAHAGKPLGYTFDTVGPLGENTAWRAALVMGLVPGGFLSARLVGAVKPARRPPGTLPVRAELVGPSRFAGAARAGAAGFLITFGGLLGGGCTLGAFMAGWPTLSVGSFAMGMTFFMAAMVTAFVLHRGSWHRVREARVAGRLTLATD